MLTAIGAEYTTVDEVVRALERVESRCLPLRDRRGVFATAYLRITRAIQREIARGGFRDPAWTTSYLVDFGNLYRQAVLDYENGRTTRVPAAWRVAFDAARDGHGFVIQHLVLGINAHINHDLALALSRIGIGEGDVRANRYHDHTRVNEVLEGATAELKGEVSRLYAPLLQRLDWVAGRLDDDATRFSIPRAREHAWAFAVSLEGARTPAERELLTRALDRQAAVLARLILAPPTRHPVLVASVRFAERLDSAVRGITRLPVALTDRRR
jgi:hypothetical protein